MENEKVEPELLDDEKEIVRRIRKILPLYAGKLSDHELILIVRRAVTTSYILQRASEPPWTSGGGEKVECDADKSKRFNRRIGET